MTLPTARRTNQLNIAPSQRKFSGRPVFILMAVGWIFNLWQKGGEKMKATVIKGQLTYIDTRQGIIVITDKVEDESNCADITPDT